jgi:CheY-like chemotaxis protein
MEKPLKLVTEAKTGAGLPARSPKEKHPFLEDEVTASSGRKAPATIGGGRRILVVDDNPVVLKAFELKLRANGFEVVTLSNAANVVGIAEKAAAELIILDINFPSNGGLDWSGYTVMQWLRRFPALTGIPVILISGEDTKNHKDKSLAAGAVAFFEKPVTYPELLSAVLRALGIPE